MFYVYYGYKAALAANPRRNPSQLTLTHPPLLALQGRELDEKVNSFSRLRKKDGEIDFSEFLELMDEIGLTPVIGGTEQARETHPVWQPTGGRQRPAWCCLNERGMHALRIHPP